MDYRVRAAFLLAGAEPGEMITAAIASGRHHPGLAAGDAVGANLTMLTLVLGLADLARPPPFGGRVRTYAAWSALAGGLAALLVAGGHIGRAQGGLLLAAYLAGPALLWSAGVHLLVGCANLRAAGFYRHIGFAELPGTMVRTFAMTLSP